MVRIVYYVVRRRLIIVLVLVVLIVIVAVMINKAPEPCSIASKQSVCHSILDRGAERTEGRKMVRYEVYMYT